LGWVAAAPRRLVRRDRNLVYWPIQWRWLFAPDLLFLVNGVRPAIDDCAASLSFVDRSRSPLVVWCRRVSHEVCFRPTCQTRFEEICRVRPADLCGHMCQRAWRRPEFWFGGLRLLCVAVWLLCYEDPAARIAIGGVKSMGDASIRLLNAA